MAGRAPDLEKLFPSPVVETFVIRLYEGRRRFYMTLQTALRAFDRNADVAGRPPVFGRCSVALPRSQATEHSARNRLKLLA
jgi:hypothetical protein